MTTATPQPRYDEYRRVSRTNGRAGDTFLSPEQQRDKIAQWGSLRDVEILQHEPELDVTGGKLSRPIFDHILERVRTGESDGIVVSKLDRFSRAGVGDALKLIESILEAGGKVASVEEGIDPTTPTGEFSMTLFLALARMQRRQLADGWDSSITSAIDRGVYIGGRAPLGYVRGPGGVLEPDPATADLVRRAYRTAVDSGLASAGRVLGLRDAFAARRLLSSRIYLGEIAHGEKVNASAHPPLVPLTLWLQANGDDVAGRSSSLDYPLSGVARCECGEPLNGQRGHARADGSVPRRYRCSAVGAGAKGKDHVSLMAEPLETLVTDALLDWLPTVVLPDTDDEIAELTRQLEAAEVARSEFARDLELAGVLGADAWRQGAEARTAEVDRLTAELAEASRTIGAVDWIDDVVTARNGRDDPELLRRAVGKLVTRVDVERGAGDPRVSFAAL